VQSKTLTQEIQDISKPVPQEHFFNLPTTSAGSPQYNVLTMS